MGINDVLGNIEPGELLTRSNIARRVGRSVNGSLIQMLERAVARGILHKHWVLIGGHNTGWGYCLPETSPGLFGDDAGGQQ